MSSLLTVYFSATGTTRHAARLLSAESGSALHEIRPVEPYTFADLNWSDSFSRCAREQHNNTILPTIAENLTDICRFSTVLLGFPVWYGRVPAVIRSFLAAHDLTSARIVVFMTSGGSNPETITDEIERLSRGACVSGGKVLNGPHVTRGYVRNWLERIRVL